MKQFRITQETDWQWKLETSDSYGNFVTSVVIEYEEGDVPTRASAAIIALALRYLDIEDVAVEMFGR